MNAMGFPDPRTYDFPEWALIGDLIYHAADVVSFGDPLDVETVAEAYRKGIFPWFIDGVPLPWYCPERRAILSFDELHIPRSLEKERRREDLTFTIDKALPAVIMECSKAQRSGQKGTWITRDFIDVYTQLHHDGMVHSVEAWDMDGELAGGLYGVDAGGVFCGESMFYHRPNASKLALLFLIDHLGARGAKWLDCQVMTPHMKLLGAKEISRGEFLRRLERTQAMQLDLWS